MKSFSHSLVICTAALALTGAVGCISPQDEATAQQDQETALNQAITARQAWGLPADRDFVAKLVGTSQDVGSKIGLPMTQSEADRLDLDGRMIYANQLKASVVPYVQSLPISGGVALDQDNNGSLIVYLTDDSASVLSEISRRMPNTTRPIRVVKVQNTEQELVQGLETAWDAWSGVFPGIRLKNASVDIQNNAVSLGVDAADLTDAQAGIAALQAKLAFKVTVKAAATEKDTQCEDSTSGRTYCDTPTRAGTRLYRTSTSTGYWCTMAFHVVQTNGDVEFVTGNHCNCDSDGVNCNVASAPQAWYLRESDGSNVSLGTSQKGLGFQTYDGSTKSTAPMDIMRAQLPVAQKSHLIIGGGSRTYNGSGGCPALNQTAYVSRGASGNTKVGKVASTWTKWTSSMMNRTVYGGDFNTSDGSDNIGGDSGSPIFDTMGTTSYWGTVGVNVTVPNQFAILCHAESGLGITGLAY